jgi:glycosyltransferase involved in cell wall biosynthesis
MMKIGWVLASMSRKIASSRIRAYNIMEYLKKFLNVENEIYREGKDYDIVVFVKTLEDKYVELARSIKTITVFDIMDNHFNYPNPTENVIASERARINCIRMSKICDYVTTPSSYLANFITYYNGNCVIIPDATEDIYLDYVKRHIPKEEVILVWQGYAFNLICIKSIFPVLSRLAKRYKIALHIITDTADPSFRAILPKIRRMREEFNIVCKHWSLETRAEDLLEGDIGVSPLIENDWTRCKSNNKIASYMAMAIPTVGTPIPSYKETIKSGVNGFLASTEEDWYNHLEKLIINHNLRNEIGQKGRETVLSSFTLEKIGNRWLSFFKEIYGKGKAASKKPVVFRKNKNKKIAIFVGKGRRFVDEVIEHLKRRHEVRIFEGKTVGEMENLMKWSDISFFEWVSDVVIYASKLAKTCKMVCRLYNSEVYTEQPKQVIWEVFDDLIFLAPHIRDILKLTIPDIEERVKTHIIHNGIDLTKFNFRERDRGYNLAYVGIINHKKNPSLLLQCLKHLVNFDSRYILHVAGLHRELMFQLYWENIVKETKLENNIKMYGWVEDVSGWLEDKNYILSTSIGEGYPVGIIEAMAKGIKPIIHNWPGAKELFPERYIFNTIGEFSKMVLGGEYNSREYRAWVEENYSLERQIKKIEEVLFHEG